ncbi:unnamed protein product [Caenorhabditis sp. 36 PRJEB53466]|nr:unnamed protein product [Caenorhabditis sp. 36 PRJEB53466]
MSANLPPAFKPIAPYIKIANENASRDPVIYYWWLCMTFGPNQTTMTFDEKPWKKLQESIRSEKREKASEVRDCLREYIDEKEGIMSRHQMAETLTVKVEEKRIGCEELKKKIAQINSKILMGRQKLAEVNEQIEKREKDEQMLENTVKVWREQAEANKGTKKKKQKVIGVLVRLIAYRKLTMMTEVIKLFRVVIDGGPASREGRSIPKACYCQLVDTIRGIHLPQTTMILAHPEIPTLAATGLFFHIFNVFCRILGYAPRFSIDFSAPSTAIFNTADRSPIDMTIWKKRSDRERFQKGMLLMEKNISQLRIDCGIPTMVADRTLATLVDWFKMIVRRGTVFERPADSVFSPASLLVNFQD